VSKKKGKGKRGKAAKKLGNRKNERKPQLIGQQRVEGRDEHTRVTSIG